MFGQGLRRYLCLLFFLAGLIFPVYLPAVVDIDSIAIAFVVCCCLIYLRRSSTLVLLPLLLVVGFCISSTQLSKVVHKQLGSESEDALLTVKVTGLPVVKNNRWRFDVTAIALADKRQQGEAGLADTFIGQKVRLSWQVEQQQKIENAPKMLAPGQVWNLYVRIKPPRGLVNPGGFDYQAWLLHQGVTATGYVKSSPDNSWLFNSSVWLHEEVRHNIRNQLFSELALAEEHELQEEKHHNSKTLLMALLIGDKSAITPEQWQVLRLTGTAHLMAISGLHIGLIAAFSFVVFRRLIAIMPRWQSATSIVAIPVFAAVICSGLYAAIAGFAIPTQRAWIAVVLFACLKVLGKKGSALWVVLLVLSAVVMLNPLSLLQNGTWLSFGAVLCLIYCFSARWRRVGFFSGLFSAQAVIFVGLTLLLTLRFFPVSVMSPVANLVAVPVVSFLVIPLAFIAVLLSPLGAIAHLVLDISDAILSGLWHFLAWLSVWDTSLWLSRPSGVGGLMLALIGMLFVLSPLAFALRLPGLCLLVLSLSGNPQRTGDFRMAVLDVGQGLSVVLESAGEVLVYDLGAKLSQSFDMGSRVVAPYLRYRQRSGVDLLVISHGDNDHAGGLEGFMSSAMTVREFAFNHSVAQSFFDDRKNTGCYAGQQWQVGELKVQALWPVRDQLEYLQKTNNRSCVLMATLDNKTILLAGDIEEDVEALLLASGTLPKNIDILIAPHHGSKTSSSTAFIHHLSPEHVIFSAGYRNRYGHPAEQVVEAYKHMGAKLYDTGTDGAITARLGQEEGLKLSKEREINKRPWFR